MHCNECKVYNSILCSYFSHDIILKLFIIFITKKKLTVSNHLFVYFVKYFSKTTILDIGFVHDMYIEKSHEFYV